MKSFTGAAWVALAISAGSLPSFAQMQNNTDKQLSCNNSGNDGDRSRYCEIKEQSPASIGRLAIDAGRNGGVTVKGWLRGDTLVRARIEAEGENDSAARSLVSQVNLDTAGGQVHATGPETPHNSSWSVSFEIFVPQSTDLNVKAHNGGINIQDVRGQIHFEGNNGGVNLKRVAGDVSGQTVNGGVQVDLTGGIWEGRQLEVSTRNGGVTLTMPAHYSAHVQAETQQGRIQSDFATNAAPGNERARQLDTNIGAGGPLIHVTTQNGGVRLKRADTQ